MKKSKNNTIETRISREHQVLLLQRQWELVEVAKSYRHKFTFSINAVLLAMTGYIVKAPELLKDNMKTISVILIVFLTCVGIFVLWNVFQLIRKRFKKIESMYAEMKIDGKEYWGGTPYDAKSDDNQHFDLVFFITTIVVGSICSVVIYAVK